MYGPTITIWHPLAVNHVQTSASTAVRHLIGLCSAQPYSDIPYSHGTLGAWPRTGTHGIARRPPQHPKTQMIGLQYYPFPWHVSRCLIHMKIFRKAVAFTLRYIAMCEANWREQPQSSYIILSGYDCRNTPCSEKSDIFVFPYISHNLWTNFIKLSVNIRKWICQLTVIWFWQNRLNILCAVTLLWCFCKNHNNAVFRRR